MYMCYQRILGVVWQLQIYYEQIRQIQGILSHDLTEISLFFNRPYS